MHVVDARTFETEEILKVPTVRSTEPRPQPNRQSDVAPSQLQDRPSQFHRHVFSSLTATPRSPTTHLGSSPSSPRRASSGTPQPQIIQALNDAFRITTPSYSPPSSISDSTWRTLRLSHIRNGREGGISGGSGGASGNASAINYEDIVVIPSLGDRNLESEVHALLNPRNNNNREYREEEEEEEEERGPDGDRNTGSSHADYDYRAPVSRSTSTLARQGDDMEVDELESDCLSSRTPSRSTSPVPPQTTSSQDRHAPNSTAISTNSGQRYRTRQENKPLATEISYRDDLDIAGTCFDPSGGRIYVATKENLVEWSLRDADKRWWTERSWR